MEILRIPPYSLTKTIAVSSANTSYDYTVIDMADSSVSSGTVTSNSSSNVSIPLSSDYDTEYKILVDNVEEYVTVVRPYVNPNTKAETASEIAEYTKNEEIARAIIDSVITQGFYYKKQVIETAGLGADYLPLWVDAKKVLKVYSNNVLVYDSANPSLYQDAFEITGDGTALIFSSANELNRHESMPNLLPMAPSDIDDVVYYFRGFPKGNDFKLVLEVGNRTIPSDIVRATELLVDDISCGKLDYYKRYISDYNTDQFKIKFDSRAFEGTGNIIVDKILSKYLKSIQTLGVL